MPYKYEDASSGPRAYVEGVQKWMPIIPVLGGRGRQVPHVLVRQPGGIRELLIQWETHLSKNKVGSGGTHL